jgi:hypothetical protein
MAREKFDDRRLVGNINVACKFQDGTVKYWQTTKEEVVQHIIDILADYAEDDYIITLRQLHYQFVKSNWIINHDTAYKKLGTILDDCRYAGIIDWNAIEDRGRKPYIPYSVRDPDHALQDTVDQYRLDRQLGQEVAIELWTEKDALSGILQRTTEKYHIQLVVNKGYTSSSAIYRAYQRILDNLRKKQFTTILYFGDHDPSGLDMIRDINERLTMMLEKGHYELTAADVFQVLPIGLTMKQIRQYKLPPNPTKMTDTRSDGYIKKFGKTCWEVDALDPRTLTEIVEAHIVQQIDVDLYEEMLVKEAADIRTLEAFINKK